MNRLIDAIAEFTTGNMVLERLTYVSAEILILGGALALAFSLFKVRPRVRAVAWQVFFIVVLFHFSFGPVFSFRLPESLVSPTNRLESALPVTEDPQFIAQPAPAALNDPRPTRSLLPAPRRSESDPAGPPASSISVPWPSIVFGIWCFGALPVGAFYLFSRYRLSLLARNARPAGPELQQEMNDACDSLVRWLRPRVVIVSDEYGPAVGGVFRPVVILPEWLEAPNQSALRYWAMRHELMHLRRLDHWTDLMRRVACSVFFFHPVVWWASRSWEKAAELVCDQALPQESDEAVDYAKVLFEYSERANPMVRAATAGALTATRVSLAERIRALMKWSSSEARGLSWRTRALIIVAGLIVLLVGIQLSNDVVSAQEGDGSFVSEWRNWFGIGKRFRAEAYTPIPIDPDQLLERTLQFPNEYSLGRIYFEGFDGPAQGSITVPAGVAVSLSVSSSGGTDLSPLSHFEPNAIQRISFQGPVPDAQLAHLSHLSGINRIRLFNCGTTDQGLAHLSSLTNLTDLDLNSTFVTDEGLRYLRGMQKLDNLDINRTKVTDAGMVYIAELKNLSVLDLWHTAVSDEGVAILSRLPGIVYIGLEDCPVTDAAVQYFRNWSNLAQVDLENTSITDEAIHVLSQAPNIRWLDLVDTRVTDQGMAELAGLHQLAELNLPITLSSEDVAPLAGLPAYDSLQNRDWLIPVTLQVRDNATGEAIEDAEIVYIPSTGTDGHFDGNNVYHVWTDAAGQVTAYGSPGQSVAQIRVLARGYIGFVDMVLFDVSLGESGGEVIDVALDSGITIGGTVLAPNGEPLAGASVSIPTPGPLNIDDSRELPYSVLTDERGRWVCDSAPRDLKNLVITVEHPHHSGVNYQPADLDTDSLLNESAVLHVRPLMSIPGLVVDSNGNAIANAFVVETQPWRRSGDNATIHQATTDSRGRFALPATDLGSRTLRVCAAGYASIDFQVDNSRDDGPVVITLVDE